MPDSLITALSDRGRICGDKLTEFDFSQHAFTRFRVSLCALEEYLVSMDGNFRHPIPQDEEGWEYIRGTSKPPHYEWSNDNLRDDAAKSLDQIHELLEGWHQYLKQENTRFCRGVPKPKAVLQARPNF